MPSLFDRQFKQSGFPQLLQNFGEPIVYHFRSGGIRSFYAIIERSPPAIYDGAGNVVLPSFTVRFKISCTEGVTAKEVDTGGDFIELIPEIGGHAKERKTVMKMLSQDSGVGVLALM